MPTIRVRRAGRRSVLVIRRPLRFESAEIRHDVCFQDVGGNHRHVARQAAGQIADEIAIDLDGEHRRTGGGERKRQRALARSNLQKDVAWFWPDRLDDLLRPGVGEKVLAKALARPVATERTPAASSRPHCSSPSMLCQ